MYVKSFILLVVFLMYRPPPISTRYDTLFPSHTLFRSVSFGQSGRWCAASTSSTKGMDDVGYCDTQARNHQGQRPGWHRYRFPGGPGRDPHGAHREPDRALQDPREGQPFAARPLDDGQQAPLASRLSPQGRRSALSRSYREARSSQINVGAAPPGPLRISGLRNSAAPAWVIWAQTHRAEARLIGRPGSEEHTS